MLTLHGLSLAKVLVALRHIKAIEPSLFRLTYVVKEQNIGSDARIGIEHAARQTNNGVQIELV